jgi:CTP:molybdopterin cytidylyltransferase MocA
MSSCAPSLDSGTAFALLAAGSARRSGGAKLAVDLGSKPLLRWAAEAAVKAGFQTRLLIVPSPPAPDFGLGREGWTILVNPEAETGMASSIRAAALAADSHDRLVLGLADMPFVTAGHYRTLAKGKGVLFTRYPSGRVGVPAAFDRQGMARLQSLSGDRGATSLAWPAAAAIVPSSFDELFDVDTAEDLARARSIARSRQGASGDCG